MAVLNLAVPIVQVTGTFVSRPQEVFDYPMVHSTMIDRL